MAFINSGFGFGGFPPVLGFPQPQPQPQPSPVPFNGFPNNPLSAKDSNLLRMVAHDMYDGGIDGSIPVKLLLQGKYGIDLGEADILKNPQTLPNAQEMLAADIRDNGRIDGSNAAAQMGRIYKQVTGVDISNGLRFAQTRPATLQSLLTRSPDPTTPQGWQQVMAANRWSGADMLASSMWGHDLIPSPIDDGRLNGSYLQNPSLDTKIINGLGLQPFINSMIASDQQRFGQLNGVALDNRFLQSMELAFRTPVGALGRI